MPPTAASLRAPNDARVFAAPETEQIRTCEYMMSRLTITISDARHRALKEAAIQLGKTIGQLIAGA